LTRIHPLISQPIGLLAFNGVLFDIGDVADVVVIVSIAITAVDIFVGTFNYGVSWAAQMITWSEPGPKKKVIFIPRKCTALRVFNTR
jgi:hypothetical protein